MIYTQDSYPIWWLEFGASVAVQAPRHVDMMGEANCYICSLNTVLDTG